MLKELISFLRERRDDIVKREGVLVENYDPTFGLQDPITRSIEVVDFEELLRAIDDFADSFNDSKD